MTKFGAGRDDAIGSSPVGKSGGNLLLITLIALAPPILVWVVGEITGMPPGHLTRDPAALTDSPWYLGTLSTLGLFLWASAVTSATLGFLQARRNEASGARVFVWAAAISAVLAFDDAFQIHEEIGPEVLGVPQRVVYSFYLAMLLTFVWRYHRVLVRMGAQLPITAGVFFAISFVVDAVESVDSALLTSPTVFYIEDGAKFVGIAFWSAFLGTAAFSQSRRCAPEIDHK